MPPHVSEINLEYDIALTYQQNKKYYQQNKKFIESDACGS